MHIADQEHQPVDLLLVDPVNDLVPLQPKRGPRPLVIGATMRIVQPPYLFPVPLLSDKTTLTQNLGDKRHARDHELHLGSVPFEPAFQIVHLTLIDHLAAIPLSALCPGVQHKELAHGHERTKSCDACPDCGSGHSPNRHPWHGGDKSRH